MIMIVKRGRQDRQKQLQQPPETPRRPIATRAWSRRSGTRTSWCARGVRKRAGTPSSPAWARPVSAVRSARPAPWRLASLSGSASRSKDNKAHNPSHVCIVACEEMGENEEARGAPVWHSVLVVLCGLRDKENEGKDTHVRLERCVSFCRQTMGEPKERPWPANTLCARFVPESVRRDERRETMARLGRKECGIAACHATTVRRTTPRVTARRTTTRESCSTVPFHLFPRIGETDTRRCRGRVDGVTGISLRWDLSTEQSRVTNEALGMYGRRTFAPISFVFLFFSSFPGHLSCCVIRLEIIMYVSKNATMVVREFSYG